MEVKSRLAGIAATGDAVLLTFSVPLGTNYDGIRDKDLRLKASVWREKRSLSANAYFYVLVGKLAARLSVSVTEVHNEMISSYGEPDEEIKTIVIRDDIDWRRLDSIHLRPTSDFGTMADGVVYRKYVVMRGSHTYDSKEMARLIDGTVQECKQQEIETLPPAELRRMYEEMAKNEKKAMVGLHD